MAASGPFHCSVVIAMVEGTEVWSRRLVGWVRWRIPFCSHLRLHYPDVSCKSAPLWLIFL
jgi:hypothetical protein